MQPSVPVRACLCLMPVTPTGSLTQQADHAMPREEAERQQQAEQQRMGLQQGHPPLTPPQGSPVPPDPKQVQHLAQTHQCRLQNGSF